MTLGECFDQIRKTRLNGSVQKMSVMAMNMLQELKYKHYLGEEYPRKGWLLSFEDDEIYLFNKDFRIELNLHALLRTKRQRQSKLYCVQKTN